MLLNYFIAFIQTVTSYTYIFFVSEMMDSWTSKQQCVDRRSCN
jgi:hypothetical protein